MKLLVLPAGDYQCTRIRKMLALQNRHMGISQQNEGPKKRDEIYMPIPKNEATETTSERVRGMQKHTVHI